MAFSERSSYISLQVERPVNNPPAQFISKVAFHGARVFGTEPSAGITELGFEAYETTEHEVELLEPVSRLVTIRRPVLEVYSADSLRLILLRRVVPTHLQHKYNFNHYAGRFTALPPSKIRDRGYADKTTIRGRIDSICSDSNLDPGDTRVGFDRLQSVNSLGFGAELALIPKISCLGGIAVNDQVMKSEEELARLSNKVAYPSSSSIAFVPFMRIPDGISARQFDRFVTDTQEHLPLFLHLGRMWAHSPTITGAGVA